MTIRAEIMKDEIVLVGTKDSGKKRWHHARELKRYAKANYNPDLAKRLAKKQGHTLLHDGMPLEKAV